MLQTESGKDLFKRKVSNVIYTGWITANDFWDVNFGGGSADHAYTAMVSHYVNDNMPEEVQSVYVNQTVGQYASLGNIYQDYNVNSPQAFAIATYYGSGAYLETNNAPAWDDSAILYAINGLTHFNAVTEGSIVLDNDARVSWNSSGTKNHIYLTNKNTSQYMIDIFNSYHRFEP